MNTDKELPCCDLMHHLNALIDGDLDPETTELIQNHMESCQKCRAVINTLNKTIALCQEGTQQIHLPQDVHNRLLEKLHLCED